MLDKVAAVSGFAGAAAQRYFQRRQRADIR